MNEGSTTTSGHEKSRRRLLALAGGGGVAAIAALFARGNSAQAHHGSGNFSSNTGDPAIHGDNSDAGEGVLGTSATGFGVSGYSDSGVGVSGGSQTGDGVDGSSQSGNGVTGASDSGVGVNGHSESGHGVRGQSGPGGFGGVEGFSPDGHGVHGASESGPGVWGQSMAGHGILAETYDPTKAAVLGQSVVPVDCLDPETGEVLPKGPCPEFGGGATGIWGRSLTGHGVLGESESGTGVQGNTGSETGVLGINHSITGLAIPYAAGVRGKGPGEVPGVHAVSGIPAGDEAGDILDGGVALRVDGKSLFSTAGAGNVPQGQNSVVVSNLAVTALSHISVTLMSDPEDRQVSWVSRDPGVGFTLQLTTAPPNKRPETSFTYLIVEPVS